MSILVISASADRFTRRARSPASGPQYHDGGPDGPLMGHQVLRWAVPGSAALHGMTPLTWSDFVRRGWPTGAFAIAKGCPMRSGARSDQSAAVRLSGRRVHC